MNEVMTQTTMKPKGGPKTLIEIDLSQSPYVSGKTFGLRVGLSTNYGQGREFGLAQWIPLLQVDNPNLIYASLSGFGPDGPYAGKGAYDTVIQAYGGFAANQANPADHVPMSATR